MELSLPNESRVLILIFPSKVIFADLGVLYFVFRFPRRITLQIHIVHGNYSIRQNAFTLLLAHRQFFRCQVQKVLLFLRYSVSSIYYHFIYYVLQKYFYSIICFIFSIVCFLASLTIYSNRILC